MEKSYENSLAIAREIYQKYRILGKDTHAELIRRIFPGEDLAGDGRNFIDLGLPSGTLWASKNEPGHYTFDEANEKFAGLMPSKEMFQELVKECEWKWDNGKKGMRVTGPNGRSIFLPAAGYRNNNSTDLCNVQSTGYYWSSSPLSGVYGYSLGFHSSGVYPSNYNRRSNGFSVRLVSTGADCEKFRNEENCIREDVPTSKEIDRVAEEYAMSGLVERAFKAGAMWMLKRIR